MTVGESVTFAFTLRLPDRRAACDAIIDYRVHYAGARAPRRRRSSSSPAVDWSREAVTISRAHTFKHVSVRRIHPGPHRIDIQVNGVVLGGTDVEVVDA